MLEQRVLVTQIASDIVSKLRSPNICSRHEKSFRTTDHGPGTKLTPDQSQSAVEKLYVAICGTFSRLSGKRDNEGGGPHRYRVALKKKKLSGHGKSGV